MKPEDNTKQPRGCNPEAVRNGNNKHLQITEQDQQCKPKQRFVTKGDALGRGEFLISYLSHKKGERGVPRKLRQFAVSENGEIFISPLLLSPWGGISAFVDEVALAIEGVRILAPLSWAKANYPEHAKLLQDLEMKIRESLSSVSIVPDENDCQVTAREGQTNGK
jgi:hypothetical protein